MKTNKKAISPVISRRDVLLAGSTVLASQGLMPVGAAEPNAGQQPTKQPFGYCLNTSTISGQNIGIVEELKLAAQVGFQAVEPWVRELDAYQKKGGSLPDLRKLIQDLGLKIPNAIGFAKWMVDDEAQRAAGLEQAKREMDWCAQIGAVHMAAPPIGAHDRKGPELPVIAERYHHLLEMGDGIGIIPVLEMWGSSKTLNNIGEAAYIAIQAQHPKSCILLDIYHLYKGGSDFNSLRFLNGSVLPVIHTNDYPADPPRQTINDSFRVFPGDGVAPLGDIFHTLKAIGFNGYLSVELFNRGYWKESPLKVAKEALEKTQAAVSKALG